VGPSKEDAPVSPGFLAILLDDKLFVLDPVVIPSQNGHAVVSSTVFNGVNLEASSVKLLAVPTERARGIGSWEDILVHEKSPDQVFVLPSSSETCNLKIESTVILQKSSNLMHEFLIVSDTNMLTHFNARNLIVLFVIG
jgi:hypothetical protein